MPVVADNSLDSSTYRYNGLNWRITKLEDTSKADGYDQQRQMYYSANWQLLEEDINDDYPSSSDPTRRVQYIWAPPRATSMTSSAAGRRSDLSPSN